MFVVFWQAVLSLLHFLASCFEPDLRTQLTGQKGKRSLKADAVLSVFKYSHSPEEKKKPRLSSKRRRERQRHEKVSTSPTLLLII